MTDALRTHWHNPSSVHRGGQAARQQVELARQAVAELVGGRAREITFTSGGTEAIDIAIRGVLGAAAEQRRGLVTMRTEHASVRDIGADLERRAVPVTWLRMSGGIVDLDDLRASITPGTGVVSVQWANNETGVVQPIEAVHAICRERGVLLHCDGTQWVGKMPVESPPCDLLTFAPHKFHGPKGVGVLWVKSGVRVQPRLLGTQELGRRGGTENVPGIAGAGLAAGEAVAWLANAGERERLMHLRDWFESTVLKAVGDAVVNPPPAAVPQGAAPRLWNTTNIGFPRLEAEALLMLMSEQGLCASAGAACSSGSLDPSPVLLAMGVPDVVAHGSVRFSLSRYTTREDVERGAEIVVRCVQRLRSSMIV